MSKQHNPALQGQNFINSTSKELNEISFHEIEIKVEQFLCEAMDACKDYISKEIRDTYCHHNKLSILPSHMIVPIKAKSEELFHRQFKSFSLKIEKNENSLNKEGQS